MREVARIVIGIDIGSTTTKTAVLDASSQDVLFQSYRRHHASQAGSVIEILREIHGEFPGAQAQGVITGSGGLFAAQALGLPYVQEVIANSIAIKELHPNVRTAIELGGQDAKIIFFSHDANAEDGNGMRVSDMRMNGSCAGGTGAFIDEIATLLNIPIEDFNGIAQQGTTLYDISGRCGVYAKTDIQPLLNRGVAIPDIALSSMHAIAKQTIGGLAQGLDINPPVIFEGGPLTFNPMLVEVFKQRLELSDDQAIAPESAEAIVALGAALAKERLFKDQDAAIDFANIEQLLAKSASEGKTDRLVQPFFEDDEQLQAFKKRHALPPRPARPAPDGNMAGAVVNAALGIDSGSTTTKFALIDHEGTLVDSFYASNEGRPLDIARKALMQLQDDYAAAGITLNITAVGTTGYGEQMFAKAFHADAHVIETVAHAKAVEAYVPDASFILDIGGQDMKAMWIDRGIITDIIVNEACSSGCGSFLETFAHSLGIPVHDIARRAFQSPSPAALGSRCTVFMNSNIVTEQKNGKTADDIMAGLCRSIIENVFTKVIRVTNLESLGQNIVVQGGTFLNDAVVASMEQYVGRNVTRAPYPELMGAIGAAKLAMEAIAERKKEDPDAVSSFIGLDALDEFTYTQESNLVCSFCANHCNRTAITFGDRSTWITGNRCQKGEILGDPSNSSVRKQVARKARAASQVSNMFDLRQKLLFQQWPCIPVLPENDITIGLPRVLGFWENMPFFHTFWRALGFNVIISSPSSRKMYERGLHAVASDTVCFPAKLVHGHIRNLVNRKAHRIFMPSITAVQSENTETTSVSMCAVVKGYGMVIRNSDNPEAQWGVKFDNPLFHWYTDKDRERQLCRWMEETFGISQQHVIAAIKQADAAQNSFREQLRQTAQTILDEVAEGNSYAVVLASRPYQNDPLVNHDLASFFTEEGIPVICADSLPGFEEVDLSKSMVDIANNFHARMIASAILAAENPHLEYVQMVSFGCGHDAYLSDEIVRVMKEISGKTPLILKVDESDVQGPLRIRVRSFIETVSMKRQRGLTASPQPLSDPYQVKFTQKDVKDKLVLVPNTSHAFSMLMAAAFAGQGLRTEPLEIGRETAIRLGKQYVHNDICFPCQIVIGEVLAALKSGKYNPDEVAVAMGKYIGDCRLTHYATLTRKALDEAGFPQVPVLTNDDVDYHDMHPGFKMNLLTALRISFGLPMIDALEELLRKIRPYETVQGAANRAFDEALSITMDGLAQRGIQGAKKAFKKAIDIMMQVEYDLSDPKPKVLIVGEYLLNFHPGANHDIEDYLERNGLEVIEAKMTDVIRKSYFYRDSQNKEYKLDKPQREKMLLAVENNMFNLAHNAADKIASKHPLYNPPIRMQDLVKASDEIIHHTFDAGEGVLIPGEILHHAQHGCRNFIILQPFGCLPNHVVGRGIAKKLKELYPDAQILPLDYDPDVSFANIENRLQMLILNAKQNHRPQPDE